MCYVPLLLSFCLWILVGSCVSSKKMIYFQGSEKLDSLSRQVKEDYELRIKPDDGLYITVYSKSKELLEPFGNSRTLGSGISTYGNESTLSGGQGLLVDKQGYLELPLLGRMHVAGLNRLELADRIKQKLIDGEYIKNPTVIVRFNAAKILVLGEVHSPGMKTMPSDRVTILDAIGLAGDLPPSAHRDDILVIREVNGERHTYRVDLTSGDNIFRSPAYYLQQNDIVYVKPNKTINVKGSSGLTYLSAGSSVLGVLASVLSLIFIFTK